MMVIVMMRMITSVGRVRGVEVVVGVVGVVHGRLPTWKIQNQILGRGRKRDTTHPLVPVVQSFLLLLHLAEDVFLTIINVILICVIIKDPSS